MGLRGKASNTGGDFQPAPAGTHNAVCTRIVDCGTQPTHFGDKRRLQLGFEIDEKREDGQPFMVFAQYNLSLHEKASLRKALESWRGKAYDDDAEIDLAALAGKPALINVVHSDDGAYANIGSISPPMKGMDPLRPAGDVVVFDCDEPDLGMLDKLGERMQEKIRNSPEYRRAMGGSPAVQGDPATEGNYPPVGAGAIDDDFDDSEIPF